MEGDDILLSRVKTLGEIMGTFTNSALLRARINRMVDGYSLKMRLEDMIKVVCRDYRCSSRYSYFIGALLQVVATTSKFEQQKIALDIILRFHVNNHFSSSCLIIAVFLLGLCTIKGKTKCQVGGRQALLNLLHCVTSCCTAGERQSARHIIGI